MTGSRSGLAGGRLRALVSVWPVTPGVSRAPFACTSLRVQRVADYLAVDVLPDMRWMSPRHRVALLCLTLIRSFLWLLPGGVTHRMPGDPSPTNFWDVATPLTRALPAPNMAPWMQEQPPC